MEGEEEEASNVNEFQSLVKDATAATAGAREEVRVTEPQCEPKPQPEAVDEPPPPPSDEAVGEGDAINGVEAKDEEMQKNDAETSLVPEKEEKVVVEKKEKQEKAAVDVAAESAMADEQTVAVAANVAEEAVERELDGGLHFSAAEEEEEEERELALESEKVDDKANETEELAEEEAKVLANVAKEREVGATTEEVNLALSAEETEMEDATAKGEDGEVAKGGEGEMETTDVPEMEKGEEEEEEEEEEAEGDEDKRTAEEALEAEETAQAEAEAADVMEEVMEAEGRDLVEEEEEEEEEATCGGKRKRKKNAKSPAKVSFKKKMEEDVCFICFDGGELVLCDRRGCPKAYHPACVDRDEAFFRTKGRWNCGWHLCSNCGKNAYYMCYTCTFSLCKACIKSAVILCVRGNKGFCETCMKTIMSIEKNENNVDFDDRSSFEYLFKDYWMDLKGKLSLTLDELAEAKNPWKGSDKHATKQESTDSPFDPNNDVALDSDGSTGNLESSNAKRRKIRRCSKSRTKDRGSQSTLTSYEGLSADDGNEWASKELLEFVMHMRNGDASVLSQFDVQALLLEYIKRNKLRDPRRKSQIICDSLLVNLFGKLRVGHFEMLKLLESHFLIKEDSHADDLQGSTVDTEVSQLEADGNSDAQGRAGKDKKRKTRKKGDGKGPQSNLDDYAAIDIHNINLIYLRRNLVEDLIDNTENFHEKVVGTFVRIRISASGQKQDLYRLVQIVGTCKAAEPYKVGKRMTDILLEILNLNKTEIVSLDIISNQEFTEDECKRLRQSIKCGLINRLSVGNVQEKAMALQAVRVKDWLESEIVRLSHLRDRASEKGRRKELRECVEKLQLLKTPEERKRRLEEIPEIHADPKMDPSFQSEEEEETDDKRQENYMRPRGSAFGRRGRDPVSPQKGVSALSDTWSGTRNYSSTHQELSRNMSARGLSNKVEDRTGVGEMVTESWSLGRDREMQPPNSWEKHKMPTLETGSRSTQRGLISESFPAAVSENSEGTGVAEPAAKINESDKIWHYQDPSGKVQGPFSIVQLRKWSATGYFPVDLRIWKITEKQDDSILLTDALAGKIQKDKVQAVHNLHPSPSHSGTSQGAALLGGTEVQVEGESWRPQCETNSLVGKVAPVPVEVPKYSSDGWGSTNLPSPTPSQTPLGTTKVQAYENKWSNNAVSAGSFSGMNPASNPEKIMPSGSTNDPATYHQPAISAPVLNHASLSTSADTKNAVSNLQSLVQSVAGHLPSVETQGWGSVPVQKPEMIVSTPTPGSESQTWEGTPSQKIETNNHAIMPAQPGAHGQWGNVPTINTSAVSFSGGNAGGNFPTAGFQTVLPSDPWRPPVSGSQPNVQPSAPPNLPWDMGVVGNQNAAPRMAHENQNSNWAPVAANPNMSWAGPGPAPAPGPGPGPGPGNANMNWGVPGQGLVPGNTNPGWGAAPNHGSTHGNPVSSWGPPPMNTNANQNWSAHGQGQAPGNANPAWAGPSGNQGSWGSERSHNTDRFGNQRDIGSQGGDSVYGGGKPWNRQSSFGSGGGGGSRPTFRGQRVCKFHENGHCKKGASCDYLHS